MKVTSGSLVRSSGDDKVWPPGFRFHPTDEELILYYLKRKICGRKIKLDIIGDTDVYKWDPEELPGLSKLKTGDRLWFFFSPRDRKYPNGARSNRATRHGYWKATGKDRTVACDSRDVGVKKTLVFYKGRAPIGERTDWVMHEYTLDEEELKRCTNVQNYYALYKVFKKSGPGPKNGEQYGAPFKEEDWADDEFCDFNIFNDEATPIEKTNNNITVTEERDSQVNLFSIDDPEELMKQIPDESIFEFPEPEPCVNFLSSQVAGQEESKITAVNLHDQDHVLPKSGEVSLTNTWPCNVPRSFDFTESQQQSLEIPEAAAALEFCEQASILFEDDFLEMDDLNGPEFTLSDIQKSNESKQFGELNGLCEFDQFHDAAMFLNDLGPLDYGTIPELYQNENTNNVANFSANDFLSQLDYANACQLSSQMKMPDQDLVAQAEQTSGVLFDSSNFVPETNQNLVVDGGSTASLVSSALWAFVESIPSTPASAAENARVNRAADQIASLRRSLSTKSIIVSTMDSSSQGTRSTGRKKGFFLFSVLGALCAILWVVLGAIRVWGRCISL